MSENGYAFAVASVRAKENDLLTSSFMMQLLDSDLNTCVQLIADKGIVEHDTTDPIGDLSDYMDKTWDYISSVAPDINVLNFLIVKNDFHNLKAILKSMVTDSKHSDFFLTPCITDPDEMYDCIKEKHFDILPKWISTAAEHGYELITATLDGQLLDVYLDAQSFAAMKSFAKETKSEFAVKLSELQTALADLKVALRLSRGKNSDSLIDEAFCQCDSFDTEQLKKATEKGREDVVAFIGTTVFSSLCDELEKSPAEFEKKCDNLVITELDDARTVNFGAEPMMAYYCARENEIKMLRIILSCKHIGLGREKITERMRELYV